jgi:hypothetical protein
MCQVYNRVLIAHNTYYAIKIHTEWRISAANLGPRPALRCSQVTAFATTADIS